MRPGFELGGRRDRLAWVVGDLVGVLLGAALVGWLLLATFGSGWLWVSVLGGALLGVVVGVASARWHWGTGRTAAASVVAWFTLGGPLAMPSTLVGGIFPSLRTLRGLATAPLFAPKAMLTFDPPIGETGNLLAVPMALTFVGALGAVLVSLRTRRPQLAWLPLLGSNVAAAALGTGVQPHTAWWVVSACVLVVLWASLRHARMRGRLVRTSRRRSLFTPLLGAAVLSLAAGATLAAAPALRPSTRPAVLRDTVAQPLDLRQMASPLQSFRANVQPDRKDAVLFTLDGQLPEGAIVRLATLDDFDGLSYNVSSSDDGANQVGQFRRVGARIEQGGRGAPVDVRVSVGELGGHWLPTIGHATSVRFEGERALELSEGFYLNRATGTGVDLQPLRPGDAYRLTGFVPTTPSDEQVAAAGPGTFTQPPQQKVPDLVAELARQWRGSSTGGEAALKLQAQLRKGYFSHGTAKETPSASGHSSARVQALLARAQLTPPSMVGDEEQYAVTMALLAGASGIPARVVHGYRAPAGGSGPVTGSQVGAWAELNLAGLGWVVFDPTPPPERTLKTLPPENPPPPNKHVDDPPPRPQPPQNPPLDTSLPTEDAKAPRRLPSIDWRAVGQWTAVVGLPLLLLLGPMVAVLVAKHRRRSARRRREVVANRVAGAWAEVVDRARDLGGSPSPSATRSEQAEQLVLEWPELVAHSDPIAVAKQADAAVFRPEPVSEAEADQAWALSGTVLAALRRALPRWRWLRSVLSTRSLRRPR